jgi:succinoglycan biosynthesis protein ExoA
MGADQPESAKDGRGGPRPWMPTIDVVISTYQEEHLVGRCLEEVLAQDYPPELVTVWVVDGGSTDGTVDIVRARAATEPRLRVIADGRRRNLPASLNLVIEQSSGELVAKVDAHGFPERDFLSRAVEAFRSGGAETACAGGRPEQYGDTPFGRALALARTTRFGVGDSVYAGTSTRESVDSVQCGVYRRGQLEEVGSFDPEMAFGEDEEVNWRLRRAGYAILLDTSIRFHYLARPSWAAAYRQYRNYGRARVRVVRKHPDYLRPRHLAPAAFVVTLSALVLAAPASRAAARMAALVGTVYAGSAGLLGARAARRSGGGAGLAALLASAYVALHVGYGVGMLRGLFRDAASAAALNHGCGARRGEQAPRA